MRTLVVFLLIYCLLVTSVSGKRRCKNVSKDCQKKARQGWCSKDQSYAAMGRKCQLACKMCKENGKVFDIDARCNRWNALGYCEADSHSLYMYRSCKFSCPKLVKAFTEGLDE